MHRLVQGQHKEALPIGSELLFPSLGRRREWACRGQPRSATPEYSGSVRAAEDTSVEPREGRICSGICDGFRVLAESTVATLPRDFALAKSAAGIMPSTSVRCPSTQSGWHPPFGVGNVVAASLIWSTTLNTDPFEMVSANLMASFICIFVSPAIAFLSVLRSRRDRGYVLRQHS